MLNVATCYFVAKIETLRPYCMSHNFFCDLERHAKIQNRRQTHSGRKISGRKEKEEERKKKKNKAKFSGNYVRPRTHAQRSCAAHALHSQQLLYENTSNSQKSIVLSPVMSSLAKISRTCLSSTSSQTESRYSIISLILM